MDPIITRRTFDRVADLQRTADDIRLARDARQATMSARPSAETTARTRSAATADACGPCPATAQARPA